MVLKTEGRPSSAHDNEGNGSHHDKTEQRSQRELVNTHSAGERSSGQCPLAGIP